MKNVVVFIFLIAENGPAMRSAGLKSDSFQSGRIASQSCGLCFKFYSTKTSKQSFGGIGEQNLRLFLQPALRIGIVVASFYFFFFIWSTAALTSCRRISRAVSLFNKSFTFSSSVV